MSHVVYIEEERERQAFAERAAKRFYDEPKMYSYSDSEIQPGEYLAIRWGIHDRAVLVLKVGDMPVVIYGDLVPRKEDV